MDYRKFGTTCYIRLDRGDEIIGAILDICQREGIASAIFSGIGGCQSAEVQTFIPEKGAFDTRRLEGMLEMVSLTVSVVRDESGEYYHHTHAAFAFKEGEHHVLVGGHIRSVTVLYTAEIELRPVVGGAIGRRFDPETGTGFWDFKD